MAGDVPVWPDNMALMTVKGGCLHDAPMAALMELCSLSTGINSVSTSPFAAKEAKYWGISVDGVMGKAGNTSGLI